MKWLSRQRRGDTERAATTVPLVQMWGAKAATVALWVLVGAGALGGCAAFVVRPLALPSHAAKVTASAPSTGAEGFAELYVAAYLSEAGGSWSMRSRSCSTPSC